MNHPNRNPKHALVARRLLWILLAIVILFLVGAGAVSLPGLFRSETSQSDQPTFTVERGPLTISVTETGTIQPREQLILKSEVEGRATILFLVDEGKQVKKDDLLVELDATELVDECVEQLIKVQNDEANYVSARENLEIVKNQSQADIEKAELEYQFAHLDLKKYVDGEYPNQLKEAEAKITLAQEELSQSQEELKWSQILYEEKYLAYSDLQQDELAEKKANLDLELAREELTLLTEFTYKREKAELESDVRQNELALERTRRKASANVVQAESKLKAEEAEFEEEKHDLEKVEKQIEKAKIYAPMDGMVIYATSAKAGWRGNQEPLDEGQSVRERQELIYLPTTSSYNAEVKVHEASLDKIQPDMYARLEIEALGKQFPGRVSTIAPLPDAHSVFMNPDLKIYKTVIAIDGNGTELRNGMTCRAEIIVETYSDVLFVPIQAVIRVAGQPTVYVHDGGDFVPRPVEIGLDNNRMVHIVSGLDEGDVVSLTPPLSAAEVMDQSEIEDASADVDASPTSGEKKHPAPTDAGSKEPEQPSPAESETTKPDDTALETRGEDPAKADLSSEDREAMRQRVMNMTPEEREALRQSRGGRGGGGRQGRGGGE